MGRLRCGPCPAGVPRDGGIFGPLPGGRGEALRRAEVHQQRVGQVTFVAVPPDPAADAGEPAAKGRGAGRPAMLICSFCLRRVGLAMPSQAV